MNSLQQDLHDVAPVYAHVSFSKTLNGCLLYLVSDKTAHRTVKTVAGCLVYVFHIRSPWFDFSSEGTKCLEEYLYLGGMKWQETGENCKL